VTPVEGFAALVVDRSPVPESSAADQGRQFVELLAESLNEDIGDLNRGWKETAESGAAI
jgi:hypothetical protein